MIDMTYENKRNKSYYYRTLIDSSPYFTTEDEVEQFIKEQKLCDTIQVNDSLIFIPCNNSNYQNSLDPSYIGDLSLEEGDPEWAVVKFLNLYYIPVVIFVGFIGNILSCIVFMNTRLRMRSSSFYLTALAITDITYLTIILLVWLDFLGAQTFNIPFFCQVSNFFYN